MLYRLRLVNDMSFQLSQNCIHIKIRFNPLLILMASNKLWGAPQTDEDRFHDLIFSLAILEYANDEVWYDIHRATKGIIERVEAGEG